MRSAKNAALFAFSSASLFAALSFAIFSKSFLTLSSNAFLILSLESLSETKHFLHLQPYECPFFFCFPP